MAELYPHQKEAIALGRVSNRAFFHDCGTGKTRTALELIKYFKYKNEGPALVVCPLTIIDSAWVNDCKTFTPCLSIISLWSKKPEERHKKLNMKYDVYVCNYKTFLYLYRDIVKKGFKVLIIDESSKIKNNKARLTKAVLSLAGLGPLKSKNYYSRKWPIPHRYVLTGTPAPNNEGEYWPQIKFITGAGNRAFDDNFYRFRDKYFICKPLGKTGHNLYLFRHEMNKQLLDAMRPFVHTVKKEDVLKDLPEQLPLQKRIVILSKAERKAYDDFKKDLVLQFSNEDILAKSALVEIMKSRQLTSGFCYGTNGVYYIGNSKLNALQDLLEEIGDNQVIIWCNFTEEIDRIQNALSDCIVLDRRTKNRDLLIKEYKRGKAQYLVAHPATAGHGLTFTNCHYAIYFSLSYSWELQKQSSERMHRPGQKHKVISYALIAKNTIDEIIYKALMGKKKLNELALEYLKNERIADTEANS